jgi:hypothetical protein
MAQESKINNWEQVFFLHHRIVPAVKRVDFVTERILYIVLRDRWCNIIVLNVHATCEKESDDSKDNFYEELKQVIDNFLSNI